MIAEEDPIATALFRKYKEVRMPNLRVGSEDMKALLGFLASQDRKGPVARAESQPGTAEP